MQFVRSADLMRGVDVVSRAVDKLSRAWDSLSNASNKHMSAMSVHTRPVFELLGREGEPIEPAC